MLLQESEYGFEGNTVLPMCDTEIRVIYSVPQEEEGCGTLG